MTAILCLTSVCVALLVIIIVILLNDFLGGIGCAQARIDDDAQDTAAPERDSPPCPLGGEPARMSAYEKAAAGRRRLEKQKISIENPYLFDPRDPSDVIL